MIRKIYKVKNSLIRLKAIQENIKKLLEDDGFGGDYPIPVIDTREKDLRDEADLKDLDKETGREPENKEKELNTKIEV